MSDYGSVREWVRNEFLLPYLVIGGDENRFWSLTPKTIQLYFEVYNRKLEIEEQKMWLMGQYIRHAIASSQGYVVSVPLMTEEALRKAKPNQYPEFPQRKRETTKVTDEQWLEQENLKCMMWLNSIKPMN